MPVELQLPAKCPVCARLTVDNEKHCPAQKHHKPGRWAKACQWMRCATCGTVYSAAGSYRPAPTRPTV